MEEERLDRLPIRLKLQKMETDYDLKDERECFSCFYDLHLSAVSCKCSPDRFSCLKHVNLLCSCEIDNKCVLYRYPINELNMLIEALEGELEALEVWKSAEDHLVVSVDKTLVSICKPKIENGNCRIDSHDEREPSSCCPGTEEKLNANASCSSNSNGSSKEVQSGSKQGNLSLSTSNVTVDSHNDGGDTPMIKDNDKVGQQCCIDLNLDYTSDEHESGVMCISDRSDNKPVIDVEEACTMLCDEGKVSSSDAGREQNAMEIDSYCDLSITDGLLKKDYPICSRDLEKTCAFDGNKLFGVDLLSSNSHSEVPSSNLIETEMLNTSGGKTLMADQRAALLKLDTHIEPINIGSIVFGKLWCSKDAIFPKGMLTGV